MYWRLSSTPFACFRRVACTISDFALYRRQLRTLSVARVSSAIAPSCQHVNYLRHKRSTVNHAYRLLRKRQLTCAWARDLTFSRQLQTSICRQICHTSALLDAEPQQQHAPVKARNAQLTMDYTALVASVQALNSQWIPAKVEQVTDLATKVAASTACSH